MSHEHRYQHFLTQNPYPRRLTTHQNLINFSSNDYLGLATHPLLITRSQEYLKKYGTGSTSSRLVVGNFAEYEALELTLANALGKPAALILGTGYQTNLSVLEALLDPTILGAEPLVFCDRLCHNSMLTAARHSARMLRFQHNDLSHLKTLLEKYANTDQPKFILVESIYSMEGDTADLAGIIQLAKTHNALLYVDDAHAVGVYGAKGWGLAADYADDIDVIMGTFSKGLGSFGGYIGCSKTIRDYLINHCKGLIYSTGLPPAVLGAISAALELIPQLAPARQQLLTNARKLHEFFQENNLPTGNATTHIIPWIIGDAKKACRTSELLEQCGILGTTIRPPSVPTAKSRIRFCLSASHSQADLDQLMQAIQKVEGMQ